MYLNCVSKDYFHICYGIVAVWDKTLKKIILVVKWIPFDRMIVDEYTKYEKVTSNLISMTMSVSVIMYN